MATVSVRYIVSDIDAAIAFYRDNLGFTEVMHPAPAFAMLSRGELRLLLSVPGGGPGGGQAMPDGSVPEPGGWNRFAIEVPDLAATVGGLRDRGVRFRNQIVTGVGGKQILAEDPIGQPGGAVRASPARGAALAAVRSARPAWQWHCIGEPLAGGSRGPVVASGESHWLGRIRADRSGASTQPGRRRSAVSVARP
jgi:catechol 2,3-dioxygenase-like lactoylglutathione lyase family enzyme